MPNQFLDTLLAATAVPVTVESVLDGHPDQILGERRDPKTGVPLQSDADLMTADNNGVAARTIFSAGTPGTVAQAAVTTNIPSRNATGSTFGNTLRAIAAWIEWKTAPGGR
jgi:hypothetical protein